MGIDQQVRNDLFEFLELPLNGRQIAVNVAIQTGHGFPNLSAHNDQNTLDDLGDLDGLFLNRFIGPGKFLQA